MMEINQNNTVSVIGIGKIGLCNALAFEKAGYNVVGYDINQKYVDSINDKSFNSSEPFVNDYIAEAVNFRASTEIKDALNHSKLLFVIVGTPKGATAYDHTYLNAFMNKLNSFKVDGYHIVVSCSVTPGYFKNELPSLIKDCTNMKLSYNPQFVQQGSLMETFLNPDTVIIGAYEQSDADELIRLYSKTCKNTPKFEVLSPESVEITKFAIATFVTLKISFANFIGDVADLTPGANKFDILRAVGSDSRIGGKCLMPGWGYGGVCFPRDNGILIDYAKELNIPSSIPEVAHSYNEYHAEFLANRFMKVNGENEIFVFSDVAFKPNSPIPMIDESHKLKVAKIIANQGRKVIIKDKANVIELVKSEFGDKFEYNIV